MSASSIDRASRSEVFIGRTMAMCAHPAIAWRTRTRGDRMTMLACYFTAGYSVALLALVLLA